MAVDINPILNPEFIKDPLAHLKAAWAEGPIARHDGLVKTYSVFAYDDVKSILINHEIYGSEMPQEQKDASLGALLNNLIATDPPRHSRLRILANKAFMPPVIAGFKEQATALIEGLVEEVIQKEEVDIVNDLGAQITIGMITTILGLPREDWPMIRQWTTDVANNVMADVWLKERDPEREAQTTRVTSELSAYFHDYLAERRKKPKSGDLISLFMETEIDGDRLSDEEIEGTAMLLLLAANETTTNLIANFVRTLSWYPEQAAIMRADPALAKPALEETLRMTPSLRGTARRVKTSVELHGQTLEPGDAVFAWIATANRDPNVFDRPDEFDVHRKPNRHIAFAAGPHLCLGAPLARLEGRITAETILRRTRDIELLGDAKVAPNAIMDNILEQRVRIHAA
jgi:cytochrome P450